VPPLMAKRAHAVIYIEDSDEEERKPKRQRKTHNTHFHIDLTKVTNNLELPARLLSTQACTIDFEVYFTQVADYLFNDVALFLDGGRVSCRIVETEFYLTTTNDVHADPFTHCHPLHAKHGQWYFHQNQTR
jgi:hypothetical protein